MNKKFSTLMASLLLAGGVLSSANAAISATAQAAAAELTANEQWVVDYGKYFVLERANYYASGVWTANASYFLTKDLNGNLVYSSDRSLEDKDAYWTIKDVTPTNDPKIDGTTIVAKVKVVNANGWVLAFDKGNADTNGNLKVATSSTTAANYVDEFYVYAGSGATCEGMLCIYDGADEYRLGNVSSPLVAGGNEYEAVAVKYDAVAGTVTGASINDVNAVGIDEEAISTYDLNFKWDEGFYLKFKDYTSLEGNVFGGKLTAVSTNGLSGSTTYYLTTEDNRYIVLDNEDVWSTNTANLDGRTRSAYSGYKFKTISKHTFDQLSTQEKDNAVFTIYKSYDFNNTDSLIVTLPKAWVGDGPSDASKSQLNTLLDDKGLRLYIATVSNVNYLTAIEYDKANDMLADVQDNAYPTNGTDPYEVGALAPYIEFGVSNIVDFKKFAGKVWNITDEDGNVLTPMYSVADIDSYAKMFAPKEQVDLTAPEGHWLPYYNNGEFSFINRESENAWTFGYTNSYWVIRSTETPNLYEVLAANWATSTWKKVYITEAKDAELGKTEKGYKIFDMAEESVNGKYFSFETSLGVTAYIGKDADENVILTTDKDEAIEFRVKELSHDFEKDHDGLAGADTLMHFTTYSKLDANNNWAVDQDTVQFYHYALYDNFSEKYLQYNSQTKKFELTTWGGPQNNHENFDLYAANYAFVVKEKADGTNILVRSYDIDYDWCDTSTGSHVTQLDWYNNKYTFDNYFETNLGSAHKLYAATQPGTVADMASLYNYNDNDRITMENTDKVEYLKITASQDTVKISLKAQPNFFLYEDGTFLGMEHVADVEDMKPAMFVDTAYVRNNTYRPQYLLAMNGKYVEEVYDNAGHLLEPDTTYGRFLINAVDSANAWTGSVKTNPYIHEQLNSTPYYRLVFVDGYHTGDALTLHTGKADTKIALNNNNDKVCTFAFRYVDESREGVKIETAYGPADANGNRSRGWLKYQNNVPVVTPDYEDAHVFTVDNTTTDAPTANETIAAGNVVVAGVNGAVVVKGAEGKNVIVSTILGKVVANEVVSSDNAQISAPAGIVVVSVDGESFKVVVK